MHESFLLYRNFLYLKLALVLMLAASAAYLLHNPAGPPNGGTWLGYTLGTIGAVLILWLLWLGVRKRQYHSRLGTVTGWLSGHVYLGTALLVVATLHCAFQFGWNIHTLAYALMVVVILSGFYGVYAYRRYPERITENSAGLYENAMLDEIAELDRECLALADQIGDRAHQIMLRSIERTTIGGGLWQQLTATSERRMPIAGAEQGLDTLRRELEAEHTTRMQTLMRMPGQETMAGGGNQDRDSTAMFMAGQLTRTQSGGKVEQARRLLDLLGRKKALVARLQRNVRYHALMRFWLLIHVPLSIALLAALLVHIITVFFYW